MTVDERRRHELYDRLQETIGPEPADTLMAQLPLVEWADIAQNADLKRLESVIQAQFERFEATTQATLDRFEAATDHRLDRFEAATQVQFERLGAELGSLRRDVEHLACDLRTEIQSAGTTLRFEMTALFRGELNAAVTSQTRIIMISYSMMMIAFVGLVLGLKFL